MPRERLQPQPWMASAGARAVIAALQAEGGSDAVRYVGGCVRNAVLGLPADDVDLATTLTPDRVMAALARAGLGAVPTGIDHGTVTALAKGSHFEVTTLRRDVATDGRRAVVAFTDDWAEDAQRRDFRLNALYADPGGVLFDPTGEGLADARAGRIVFVGDPETRIREDHLRILRFFRFLAWYGRGVDAPALAACEALRDLLAQCSAERTAKELLKLLAAPEPRPAVALMAQTGVLQVALPAQAGLGRFEALVEIEPDAELRLAALLPSDPAAVAAAAEGLRLSSALKDRLVDAAGTQPDLSASMSLADMRRALYRLGPRTFRDRAMLAWAASARPGTDAAWRGVLQAAEAWAAPVLPVTGQDVLDAGEPAGPRVGQILRQVEAWWMDEDFVPDRIQALERLRRAVQAAR